MTSGERWFRLALPPALPPLVRSSLPLAGNRQTTFGYWKLLVIFLRGITPHHHTTTGGVIVQPLSISFRRKSYNIFFFYYKAKKSSGGRRENPNDSAWQLCKKIAYSRTILEYSFYNVRFYSALSEARPSASAGSLPLPLLLCGSAAGKSDSCRWYLCRHQFSGSMNFYTTFLHILPFFCIKACFIE